MASAAPASTLCFEIIDGVVFTQGDCLTQFSPMTFISIQMLMIA